MRLTDINITSFEFPVVVIQHNSNIDYLQYLMDVLIDSH